VDFPDFRKKYAPRGVLHCWADGKGDQKVENTGPLTKKRMETCDEEFVEAASYREATQGEDPVFSYG
jgi:hypothetical protein